MSLRVLHVSPLPRGPTAGGVTRHVELLASAQRGLGYEVAVLDGGGEDPGGIRRFSLPADPRTPRQRQLAEDWPQLHAAARAAARAFSPTIVHLHHLGLGAAPALLETFATTPSRPMLAVTLHDDWLLCPRGQRLRPDGGVCQDLRPGRCPACLRGRFPLPAQSPDLPAGPWEPVRRLRLQRALTARAQRIGRAARRVALWFAPSQRVLELHRTQLGISPSRMRLCRHRIPRPPASSPRQGALRRVAYLGSLLPAKGVHLLVEALRRIEDLPIELTIHGADPEPAGDYGRWLGDHAPPQVRMAGPFAPGDGPRLAAAVDLVLMPSLWLENAPFVLLESLAVGTPVVAANHGALPEWIRHGEEGLLVPPSAEAFAAALRRLHSETGLLAQLRRGAAKAAERVTGVEQQAREIDAAYRSCGALRSAA